MGSMNVRMGGLAVIAAASMTFTGCMTTPGHYENVGGVTDDVLFTGYLEQPNRFVLIQARTPGDGNWETIGWTSSGDTPRSYSGREWYDWSTYLQVPSRYWIYLDGHYWAEVRAVDYSTNEPLYTFEAGFFRYFDIRESLFDLWSDHGHGKSVTIAAD